MKPEHQLREAPVPVPRLEAKNVCIRLYRRLSSLVSSVDCPGVHFPFICELSDHHWVSSLPGQALAALPQTEREPRLD